MGCPILLRIFKISNIRSTFTFCSMVEILQQNKAFLDAAKILKISSGFHWGKEVNLKLFSMENIYIYIYTPTYRHTSFYCVLFSLMSHCIFFSWSIVNLQYWVNFMCIAKGFIFEILFYYRLLQDIEYRSLCYMVGPCWLPISYVIVCICYSHTPTLSPPGIILQIKGLCQPVLSKSMGALFPTASAHVVSHLLILPIFWTFSLLLLLLWWTLISDL